MIMTGYGVSGSDHDFFAFDSAGDVWNGTAFVAWVDADFASYRIAATVAGTIGGEDRFEADDPAGTVRYELRYRGATAALSYLAWEGGAASQASVDANATAIAGLSGDGDTIDGHTTVGALRLMLAALVGNLSGASGTTVTIRSADDSKDRITATVDAYGNRSAVTLDDT